MSNSRNQTLFSWRHYPTHLLGQPRACHWSIRQDTPEATPSFRDVTTQPTSRVSDVQTCELWRQPDEQRSLVIGRADEQLPKPRLLHAVCVWVAGRLEDMVEYH